MRNSKSARSLRRMLFLAPCLLLALSAKPSESADFSTYCQYPPYVFQSKLPSVMILVANSWTMAGLAYQDNTADTEARASGGYVYGKRYYGLFDPGYWYDSGWNKTATKTTSAKPGATYWNGSFLNWLTMRRTDVMNKLLTGGIDVGGGGSATGYGSCGNDNTLFKKFPNNDALYSGTGQAAGETIYAEFDHKSGCTGANVSQLQLYYKQGATKKLIGAKRSVIGDPADLNGLIQRNLPKAQIGLAFYNENGDGANVLIPPKATWGSTDWNKLKTPSQWNNAKDQPLADALFTVSSYFAQVLNSNALVNTTTLGSCTSSSPCGPDYAGSGFSGRGTAADPYYQHGALSQCTKGSVIIITDGEPCSDGNLPSKLAHLADNTLFHCIGSTCDNAIGFPSSTTIPSCTPMGGLSQVGRETGSLEDVALWAHTRDLRDDIPNSSGKQNLDIWIVRAFGFAKSNLLQYAGINGSFDTASDNVPKVGNFDPDLGYFQADDPYAIENKLNDIFQQLLKRATSGTAASVLASGEGSGANLVQAVFFPKRIFTEQVIDWTGTLQNFWYYIDPFFGNSSIREDSDQNDILNLVSDNTVTFFFDPVAGVTKANSYANDNTGKATGTPTVVPFEKVKSLWEAGKFLHSQTAASRTIFTVTGSYPKGIESGTVFTTGNKAYFSSYLGSVANVDAVINYVRGVDDLSSLRERTVLYPNPVTGALDNTVWKLGDIVNSTPRVVASVPLNTYNRIYNDSTYKSFIDNTTYKNRGMVFAGANDGMLHAFKLGKLLFPGDNSWSAGVWDRAFLDNTTAGALGSERWAFIPKNALPYLQALPDNNYCHLYYVDLAPQVFDASIGGAGDNATTRSANHWATILIGGMRFGGACRDNTATCTDCVKSPVSGGGFSSYFAIDVTDPEVPSVLWEFPDSALGLGLATTGPAIVRINAGDRSTKGNWFAVFGSGPTGPISSRQFLGRSDQNLKLFIVDLKTGTLLRTIDTGIVKAFAGSMINSTADFDLDYTDDVLYIGYVKENAGTWNRGGVLRLQTKGSVNPNDWVASKVIDNIGPVTSSVVRLQNNTYGTNWLYFGSGRYYYALTGDKDDPTDPKRLYGIKEPCFGVGGSTVISPTCSTDAGSTVLESALTNVDTTSPAESVANSAGFKGWYIPLDSGNAAIAYDNTGAQVFQAERVITDPLSTAAGVVFFTTLRPYDADCAVGGRTFLWAVRYNTGGAPPAYALQGKALMQVSTASVEQLDLGNAFSKSVAGADASLHRGGRRSYAMEGVPPTAQGLSLLVPPPPVRRILHMKER